MKDVIIIDSTLPFINNSFNYIFTELTGHNTSFDIVIKKIESLNFDKIILLPDRQNEYIDRIKKICKEKNIETWEIRTPVKNNAGLYENLNILVKEKKIDNIILFYLDSPLIDVDMINNLYKMHKDNISEYTFGDNFVEGLSPEVMSKDFISKITEYKYKKPDILGRKVFDCIDADINKFFIELEIAAQDFSIMRIELTASSKRNFKLLTNLLEFTDVKDGYRKYYKAIIEHPEILFIFPRYVEIEITNDCNLSCVFCAREKMKRKKESMDFELYKKIIDQLTGQYDDIIISFTLMGEPLMHPEFLKFVDYTIKQKNIFTLIVESNGALLNEKMIKELSGYPAEKLVIVFGMDSLNSETYSRLRKSDDKGLFEKAKKNIIDFIEFNQSNKLRTFIQILKMKDNNLEIEDFYNFWHSRGVNVVIQKYNQYLDELDDRTVVDLTPLDRIPCWHIQKDMEIFSNGDVPVCKQDFNGKIKAGNAGESSIGDIWNNLKKYFLLNYKEKYDKIGICKECDEWYTYNF